MGNTSTLYVFNNVLLNCKNKTKVRTKKVILVDKNIYFREALKRTLEDISSAEIIAQFSNGNDFLDFIKLNNADIIFTDIKLDELSGIEITKKALEINPNLSIFAFTSDVQQVRITQMLYNGAQGYISKCKNNLLLLKEIIKNPKKQIFVSKEIYNKKLTTT